MNYDSILHSAEGKASWVRLPREDGAAAANAALMPSVTMAIRRYCGLVDHPQYSLSNEISWAPQWIPNHLLVSPELLLASTSTECSRAHVFGGNESQAAYLRNCGFPNARAIGAPFCYDNPPLVARRPRSLLLVPGNLFLSGCLGWKFAEYLAEINVIRSHFEDVVAYLHPQLIRRTDWVAQLTRAGIPVIPGLDDSDGNSICRSRLIYQQFEFVTSNGLNAQLPCAAACGAKVSIFGTYATTRIEDFEDSLLFLNNPGLASRVVPLLTENVTKVHFPSLFCSPQNSHQDVGWGRAELGWECCLEPTQLKALMFRKPENSQVNRNGFSLAASVSKIKKFLAIPRRSRVRARTSALSQCRASIHAELERLRSLSPNTPGSIEVQGELFHYVDAMTFHHEYTQVYLNKCYEFPSIYDSPRVIDAGANIGIASRYWLSKFPKAKLLAFEPDPRLFEVLKKNFSEFASDQVDLHNAALWKTSESLRFCSTGYETGHLVGTQSKQKGDSFTVRTRLLSDFLDQPIEFLKLDIEGAEEDVFLEAASKLNNVKRIWFEFHSFVYRPQSLGVILEVLRTQGFRYHIVTESVFDRPLKVLEATYGMDQRLNVWAIRGDCFPNMVERDMDYLNAVSSGDIGQ